MEREVLAVVGARLNSSRLPRKHLLNLSGKPVIARVFERLSYCEQVTTSLLMTTKEDYNQDLILWCETFGQAYFQYVGDVNDLVGRIHHIFEEKYPEYIVYICGDCPLIDPKLIDNMVLSLNKHDGDIVLVPKKNGKNSIHEGINVYSRRAWECIYLKSKTNNDKEHVGSVLSKIPHQLKSVIVDVDEFYYRHEQRISIDTRADYLFMKKMYDDWFAIPDQQAIVSLEFVVEKITTHNVIKNMNAHVMQRSAMKKNTNIVIACQASPDIGLGHLIRMIRLAYACQEVISSGVYLLCLGKIIDIEGLRFINHQFIEDSIAFEKCIDKILTEESINALIFDMHPQFSWQTSFLLNRLNDDEKLIAVIDIDYPASPVSADLWWIPSFIVDENTLKNSLAKSYYFGWDSYFLPEKPMQDFSKKMKDDKKNILILSGGSDFYKLGENLPRILINTKQPNCHYLWIQGPLANSPQIVDDKNIVWSTIKNPDNLYTLMHDADLVITVYGVTLIEALSLNKPLIIIDPVNKHEKEINHLVDNENVIAAKKISDIPVILKKMIKNISTNENHKYRYKIEDGSQKLALKIQKIIDNKMQASRN